MPLFAKLAGPLARLTRTPLLDISPVPTSGQVSPVERSATGSLGVWAPKEAPGDLGQGCAVPNLSSEVCMYNLHRHSPMRLPPP